MVRQYERVRCELAATLTVAPEHAEKVVLGRGLLGAGGRLAIEVLDVSLGGIGLRSRVFLPRNTSLIVNVCPPGITEVQEWLVVVQRAQMTDRVPTYYMGTALITQNVASAAMAQSLVDALRRAQPRSAGAAGGLANA